MDDSEIHERIESLVAEEHRLWNRESDGDATAEDRQRLDVLRVQLDELWDLFRRRRALRAVGRNPDEAAPGSLSYDASSEQ